MRPNLIAMIFVLTSLAGLIYIEPRKWSADYIGEDRSQVIALLGSPDVQKFEEDIWILSVNIFGVEVIGKYLNLTYDQDSEGIIRISSRSYGLIIFGYDLSEPPLR